MPQSKTFVGAKVQPVERAASSQQLKLATEALDPLKVDASQDAKAARPSLASFTASFAVLQRARPAPQALVFVVGTACLLWTLQMLQLTVAPNYTVNWIMKTQDFDGGSFWLLVDPSPTILALGIFGLWLVAAGFLSLLFRIVKLGKPLNLQDKHARKWKLKLTHSVSDRDSRWQRVATAALQWTKEIVAGDSVVGYYTKMLLKLGDFVADVVLVIQYLDGGTPVPLVSLLTAIVVASALSSAAILSIPSDKNLMLVETLVDILFDFLVVIAFPWLVLTYCFTSFSFNYELLQSNLQIYPAGWFETAASVIADPVQTAIIYKSLKSLRIVSVLDFFARVGVNIFLCARLHFVVQLLHDPSWRQNKPVIAAAKHRYFAGSLLVCLSVMLVAFVEESIRTSILACKPHPECTLNAWRWTFIDEDSLSQCPCLTLIDGDLAPKSYAEWIQPKDITDKLVQLAAMGDLQTIQLTNRFLPVLPPELRRCKQLIHVSLVYTHTKTMPEWFKDFTNLEYLHIEGTPESSLVSLPDDMFDKMPSLTFIHLAGHTSLRTLPSFKSLTGLKLLGLAVLLALTELPSFLHLASLERLTLSSMGALERLPDLSSVASTLKSFVVSGRGSWCCNGFLGVCNLQNPLCGAQPRFGTPAATCLTGDTATAATMEVTNKFAESICGKVLQAGTLESSPTELGMAQCNGTLYRECHEPGYPAAMCYSARFMGIACTGNPYPIAMRRRQIKDNIGAPCDPMFETWLGCQNGINGLI